MTETEWEALCDGCGQCCLHKLEDWDTGDVHYTNIACQLLDKEQCRCADYEHRLQRVPGCLKVSLDNPEAFGWLPLSCAYRCLAEGRKLADWHPLVSGDPDTVRIAGFSVRGRVVSEQDIPEEDWEEHVVKWVVF
jgi:uncharacterized cysteine cluster protein YcgN (CxxCxxCC family)